MTYRQHLRNFFGGQRLRLLVALFLCLFGLLVASRVDAQAPTPEKPLPFVPELADSAQSFRVLCYHDIRDNLRESMQTSPDPTAIGIDEFIQQLSWLNENGYHPVSLQQIIDAKAGKTTLPEKAILLTFDDGYKSVYTKVFPLLKQFHFSAVIALVGEWLEAPDGAQVQYGDGHLPRSAFVSWDDVREMVASGMVEVASHTHDMHTGILGNPQGNSLPAVVTHRYRTGSHTYESDEEYAQRVKADFRRSTDLFQRRLGQAPRAMVWPYGAYNMLAAHWAEEAGMFVTMNLEQGPNLLQDSLLQMRRSLVTYDQGLSDFIGMLQQPATYDGQKEPLERVIHVDLDYVYDPDPEQQEKNLSILLDRISRLHPTTVYLQAFADPDGNGVADMLYFPNRHLPMRADLFSRVAWQLRTRVGVRVFAWMPVMAFRLPDTDPAANRLVKIMPGAPAAASENRYHRLSPFDPLARQTIREIYEDLGKQAQFAGILFHDDATLSDYEDASPPALAYYQKEWNLPASVQSIRADTALRKRWMENKTAYLNDFTLDLLKTLREYQPHLMSARNLYAGPVLNPAAEEWFAQTLSSFLATYDFTAIMAMPYMEGAPNPDKWLAELLNKVKTQPGALKTTVFELQSRDWRNDKPVSASTLAAQWRLLHLGGARNWGYYPDDFLQNQPDEKTIMPAISVETAVGRR